MSSKKPSLPGNFIDVGVIVAIGATALTGNFWYLLVAPTVFISVIVIVVIVNYCRGFIEELIKIFNKRRNP